MHIKCKSTIILLSEDNTASASVNQNSYVRSVKSNFVVPVPLLNFLVAPTRVTKASILDSKCSHLCSIFPVAQWREEKE